MMTPREDSGSAWFVRPTPRRSARLDLYCFPYAGGNSAIFRGWAEHLQNEVELHVAQLPGREQRLREAPLESMPTVVERLGSVLADGPGRRYALFGHSMGALLAFELVRWLRRADYPLPELLIASGCPAPHLIRADAPIHGLPDDEFLRRVARRGGIPREVFEHPELRSLALHPLRADFTMFETYEYRREAPLRVPIVAFGADEDTSATISAVRAWETHTLVRFRHHRFTGDHFFLLRDRRRLVEAIASELDLVLPFPDDAPR
jgi:medium-chain acyl-[acyl-carrier-protein] hydrolase